MNKIYNNYNYIILFNLNNSIDTYKRLGIKNIKYKQLKPTEKAHTRNVTRKT